jgi:DNA polymerase III subunit epsilon
MNDDQYFQNMLIEARDNAILTARSWLDKNDMAVILDTETTGLGELDQAVQIAVLGMRGQVLINQNICPTVEISAGALAVHGLSKDTLASSPTFDLVFPEIQKVLDGKTVIIYNAPFDTRILDQSRRPYSLPEISAQFVCAMKQYSAYFGEWSEYYDEFKWQRLPAGDHSALGDCKAVLEILRLMANSVTSIENNPPF